MRRLPALLIPVIVAAVWGVFVIVGRRAVDSAIAAPWPLQLGSLKDLPARYPKRRATPAALALGPLEAPLGIRLNRFDKRPVTTEERAFSLVKAPLSKWVGEQMASTSDAISPPPAELAKFLSDHRAEIDAFAITSSQTKRRSSGRSISPEPVDAPLPNLLAHMAVTRLLIASALERGSWDYLHASWALTRVVWHRPEVLSALIARATTSMLFAAACKLPAPLPAWFGEVEELDYRRAMTAAEQADAWIVLAKMRDDPFDAKSVPERIFWAVVLPFSNIWAADLANRERLIGEELTAGRDCSFDGAAFDRRTRAAVPKFHTYSRIALPDWGVSWQRVSRLQAERELGQRVFILKSRAWPATAPDIAASQCSDGFWQYAAGELHFSRDIAGHGMLFPLRYSR